MQQGEAGAVLEEGDVVGEVGLVQPGGAAAGVDEGVLEEPDVLAVAERDDVLVVRAEQRAGADGEERVQRGRAGPRRAAQ